MLTAQQFNDIVGDLSYMKYNTSVTTPVQPIPDKLRKTTKLGALAPYTQWEKDSSALELLMDCQYPTTHGMDNCRSSKRNKDLGITAIPEAIVHFILVV